MRWLCLTYKYLCLVKNKLRENIENSKTNTTLKTIPWAMDWKRRLTLSKNMRKARNDFFPSTTFKTRRMKKLRVVVVHRVLIKYYRRRREEKVLQKSTLSPQFFDGVKTIQIFLHSQHKSSYFKTKNGSKRFLFVINFFYVCNFSFLARLFFYQTSINMCLFEVDKQCSRNMTLGKVMQISISLLLRAFEKSFMCWVVMFRERIYSIKNNFSRMGEKYLSEKCFT